MKYSAAQLESLPAEMAWKGKARLKGQISIQVANLFLVRGSRSLHRAHTFMAEPAWKHQKIKSTGTLEAAVIGTASSWPPRI